ncbi:MAG: hypothetical protein PVJ98_05765 [Akkermansiaceae bacterium]|jgi:hypothetical protein
MKLFRKHQELLRAIFENGLKWVVLWLAFEFILLVLAIGVGGWLWMSSGSVTGLAGGLSVLVIGRGVGGFMFEMFANLPERTEYRTKLPSHKEELEALRKELETDDDSDRSNITEGS